MSGLQLITEYGTTRLIGEVLDRTDCTDPEDVASAMLSIVAPVRVSLDAKECRRLSAVLIDYADELDRQNG